MTAKDRRFYKRFIVVIGVLAMPFDALKRFVKDFVSVFIPVDAESRQFLKRFVIGVVLAVPFVVLIVVIQERSHIQQQKIKAEQEKIKQELAQGLNTEVARLLPLITSTTAPKTAKVSGRYIVWCARQEDRDAISTFDGGIVEDPLGSLNHEEHQGAIASLLELKDTQVPTLVLVHTRPLASRTYREYSAQGRVPETRHLTTHTLTISIVDRKTSQLIGQQEFYPSSSLPESFSVTRHTRVGRPGGYTTSTLPSSSTIFDQVRSMYLWLGVLYLEHCRTSSC